MALRNFAAIDFETANGQRTSVCSVGVVIVRDGEIAGSFYRLIHPYPNYYSAFTTAIHGLTRYDTEDAPPFPEVWAEIGGYLRECPVLVAHNAAFDMGCIRQSLELYGLAKPDITYYCSLRAARKLYDFGCNKLDYLCRQFDIACGQHHRAGDDAEMCARLFLREVRDAGWLELAEMDFCRGRL